MPFYVAAAVIAVGGAVASADANRKAAHAQQDANARAARIEALQSQRANIDAIRQQRIRSAQIAAQAANAGVDSSSSVQGAIGAVESQSAAGIGFANQVEQLSQQRLDLLSKADQFQIRASNAKAVSDVALSLGSYGKQQGWGA